MSKITMQEESSTPATPGAGKWRLYPKTDGLYAIDDAGQEIGPFGTGDPAFRNLLINGDMSIAQRGTSVASISGGGYYVTDRWKLALNTLGTWTMSQEADAPAGSGLRTSTKLLCTTADAAPAAGDYFILQQWIEGRNLQGIRKGTSSAKQTPLSFWIKSNVTGTYIVELEDINNSRQVSASFTVSVADTWELKSMVLPSDTVGALNNDSNTAMKVYIWLAAGSTYTSGTLNTSWAGTVSANRAVGVGNLASAINNYIQITGVQLEIGGTPTDFETIPFDIQLQRCFRYYQKSFPYATAPAQGTGSVVGAYRIIAGKAGAVANYGFAFPYKVSFRSSPTVTFFNATAANNQARDDIANQDCTSTVSAGVSSQDILVVNFTGHASTAVGNPVTVHWTADAEL